MNVFSSSQPFSIAHYQLFLFDFDGLLVDSEPLHFQAYQQLCASFGLELPWTFAHYCTQAHRSSEQLRFAMGETLPTLLQQGLDWDGLYERKKALYSALLDQQGMALLPGVAEFLERLAAADKLCCVVTHSPRNAVEQIRAQHDVLRRIPYWITREDYPRPKPAPDGYREALRRYLPAGGVAVGFEDSPRGVEALLATPVDAVWISEFSYAGFAPPRWPQLRQVASFKDLLSCY